MFYKKIGLLISVFVFSFTALAQKPAWTDYYKRQSMYPEDQFLVGFVSGVNTNDEEAGKLKSVYEAMAKDKLIQMIQVEIETNNSLNISNVNGQSDEEFLSKSVSFSKANVSGLNTQSFYDRKKKEVFAIAYANKKELAFYYRNIIKSGQEDIEQKLTEGQQYVKKDDKENALKSFYEAMPVLMKIDEARTLLIALNRKMFADMNMDDINRLRLELIDEINSLQKPNDLNMSEAAYFVTYGLFIQLGNIDGTLFLDSFGFENTGLNSSFSNKWKQEFAAALVKVGKYEIKDIKGKRNNKLIAYGNYWEEGGFLKINASVSKNDELLAVSKGSVPLTWLQKENVEYIPDQIKKMNLLSNYSLKLTSVPNAIILGKPLSEPIVLEVLEGNETGIERIPIILSNTENGDKLCTSQTNEAGLADCYLPSVQTENPILRIEAYIDLLEYLNIQENSIYYGIASQQNPVSPVSIDIATEKPTVFIESKELIQGNPMDIKTLEPIVKETLAEKGYNFVDKEKDADFLIKINANTTTGSKYDGIYFAFLDANLSVIDAASGEEIYKSHIDQVKGGGSNYVKAGKKAYMLGAKKLKEVIDGSSF